MASRSYLTSSLAAFGSTVQGVTDSFDVNAIPEKMSRTMLPCLIVVPEVETGQPFKFLTMMGNSPADSVELLHVLILAEAEVGETWRDIPGVQALLDNYHAAAKTQKFLDTQNGPPYNQVVINYETQIGVTNYAGVDYHSLVFRHKYTIYL